MADNMFPQTVLDLMRNDGNRIWFEHGNRTVTAADILRMTRRVAAGLRAAGVGPGTGLAVFTSVTPETFAAMIAAWALGARIAGVRPGLTSGQLAHLLGDRVDFLLLDPATNTTEVRTAAGNLPVLCLGAAPGLPDVLAAADDGAELRAEGRPDDIARLTYTSGSTGNPKGAVQTYRAISADWPAYPDRWSPSIRELAAGMSRHVLFGSLNSQVALDYALVALFRGGTLVIPEDMDLRPFFPTVIARHRITSSILSVPRLYQMLDSLRTDPVDVSSLRALMVSGSPLSPQRFADALQRLGPVVFQGYGQTEAGLLSMLTPREALASKEALSSVGRPQPTTKLEVRGPDGAPVPPGEVGELFVRTPYQTSGYWSDPQESAEVFVDGWIRTRDLGYVDGDGYVHLAGRAREVIIVNANVYYAGAIERVLAEHPGVDQAYVVGAADEQTGEAVHAFVVPQPGARPDAGELRALVLSRLGQACVPRTVSFIAEVPVGPSGKPNKRALLASR
ncbi:class I adenylate-forming enzyme family protein [Archangium violaceum]|uniref:class I adenylate-forming enzyme family protein n=1 Tax=Archangium violaceum TaxID=83451 RepID=UPI001EF1601C|nr:AMP-binding protein [Archangium violaceum]